MTAASFETLLGAARPRLYMIAYAIVNDRTEAEDVLQDATVTGLKKYRAGEFQPGSSFDAWMGQITRFTALNARRARRSGALSMSDATRDSTAASKTRHEAVGGPIEDPLLQRAIDGLAETARLCLVLRVVGGLPYSAIAQIADVPEGTAMSHVHRSQRALRQALLSSHTAQGVAR